MLGESLDSFGIPREISVDDKVVTDMIKSLERMRAGKDKHIVMDIDRSIAMLKNLRQSLRE